MTNETQDRVERESALIELGQPGLTEQRYVRYDSRENLSGIASLVETTSSLNVSDALCVTYEEEGQSSQLLNKRDAIKKIQDLQGTVCGYPREHLDSPTYVEGKIMRYVRSGDNSKIYKLILAFSKITPLNDRENALLRVPVLGIRNTHRQKTITLGFEWGKLKE